MKILYITRQSPWPPIVGSRIRSYGIVRTLASRNEVTVALLSDTADEVARFESDPHRFSPRVVVSATPAPRWRKYRSLVFERSRSAFHAQTYGACRHQLRTLVEYEKPDVLWFFRLNSVWASGCDRYDVPVIGDMDDFESRAHYRGIRLLPRAKRIAAMFDYPLFVRAQRAAAQTCDLVLVANSGDVDSVSAMTGRRVRHAPNGFDYSTPPDFEQVRAPRIVFYGSLGYEPNIDGLRWFVREVWPQVRAAFPGVRMEIAGKPTAEAQTFASEPDIHLCGFVQSIPSFVTGGALLVVPLRSGSGTRIKVLEAWALGLPVVSTSVGCEGLDAVDGETALIADDPHRFAQACIDLLCSPDRGQTMARQAYEFAKERFDWLTLAPGLEDAVASVTRTGRASGGGQVAR